MTLGKKNCREGLNVCMNYAFNMLHHARVVYSQKTACCGGGNTPSGLTGQGVNTYMSFVGLRSVDLKKHHFLFILIIYEYFAYKT